MLRVIREFQPSFVIGENTRGIIKLALDDVLSDLENIGYTARAIGIPACAVGRDQWRFRIWILAHPLQRVGSVGRYSPGSGWKPKQISWYGMGQEKTPPRVVGGFDGIPNGLDRIKVLGNAVVPQIPEMIGYAILESEGIQDYGVE